MHAHRPSTDSSLSASTEITSLLPNTSTFATQQDYTRKTSRTGYILFLFASVINSCALLLQHIAEKNYDLSSSTALLLRGSIQFILATFALPFMADIQQVMRLSSSKMAWLVIRGCLGAVALLAYAISLSLIPVGDAAAIFFTCPVFTLMFARVFIGEHVSGWDAIASILSLLGGMLISSPSTTDVSIPTHDRILGSALVLLAAVISGLSFTIIRKLGTSIHFLLSVIALGSTTAPLGIVFGGLFNPLAIAQNVKAGVFIMAMSGVCSFISQCALSKGLQLSKAGPAVMVMNLEVPMTYILAAVTIGEIPPTTRMLGAGLVVLSAVMIAMQKVK